MHVRPFHTRSLEAAALVGLVALATGCRIPANSPLTGLAQLRPAAEPATNVLPPAAMLQHPGIVRVIEQRLEDNGFYFFVMEYLAGGDLRQFILCQS